MKTIREDMKNLMFERGEYHNGECPNCGDYIMDNGCCASSICPFVSDLVKE